MVRCTSWGTLGVRQWTQIPLKATEWPIGVLSTKQASRLIILLLIALFGHICKKHYSPHPLFPKYSRWFQRSVSNQMLGRETKPEPGASGLSTSRTQSMWEVWRELRGAIIQGFTRPFFTRRKIAPQIVWLFFLETVGRKGAGSQSRINVLADFRN